MTASRLPFQLQQLRKHSTMASRQPLTDRSSNPTIEILTNDLEKRKPIAQPEARRNVPKSTTKRKAVGEPNEDFEDDSAEDFDEKNGWYYSDPDVCKKRSKSSFPRGDMTLSAVYKAIVINKDAYYFFLHGWWW